MKQFGFGKVLADYDKAMMRYFGDFCVYDKEHGQIKVPIVYGTERFAMKADSRFKTQAQMSIHRKGLFNGSRWFVEYQLTFRTYLQCEMDQLLEQLMMRFTPHADVDTEELGSLEISIKRLIAEEKESNQDQVKLYRYDWIISTEIKR